MSVAPETYRRVSAASPEQTTSTNRYGAATPTDRAQTVGTREFPATQKTAAGALFRVLSRAATEAGAFEAPSDSTQSSRDALARWRSAALVDRVALFLLHQLAAEEAGVPFDALEAHLETADAWLALAKLLRAGLIDENGRTVYATPTGRDAGDLMETLSEPS